jgi:uncharacterized cofD-like protein
MDEFGLPIPVGDLRQGLVAQSRHRRLWRDLFAYRFAGGEPGNGAGGVAGHSLGNLILHALEALNGGDLLEALDDAEEILNTVGHVVPVALQHTTLCATLEDGTVVCGEDSIDRPGPEPRAPIRCIYLDPRPVVTVRARKALERAAKIVLGPGDLYTSILPNLLVQGVAEAVRASEAQKVYICNLMTKHGETDGFMASDFVREIHHYIGARVDRVIAHDGSFPEHLLGRYAEQEQHPVALDLEALQDLVPEVIVDQLLAIHQDHLVRHDADRLVQAIFAPPSFAF